MGLAISKPAVRPPVPADKIRICVSGFGISHHTNRARKIAESIATAYPNKYETWFYFDTRGFRPDFLNSIKAELSEEDQRKLSGHNSSPFCWIEVPDGKKKGIGGRDRLCEWVQETFKFQNESLLDLCKEEPSISEIMVNCSPGTANTE